MDPTIYSIALEDIHLAFSKTRQSNQMKNTFHDNISVARKKYGADYLGISFWEPPDDEGKLLYDQYDRAYYEPNRNAISINRYCVPGRCDYYRFAWSVFPQGYGSHVEYQSEGLPHDSLEKSLRMFLKDIDKPQVLDMLKRICEKAQQQASNDFGRRFEMRRNCVTLAEYLLMSIAPKCKAIKVMRKALGLNLKTGKFIPKKEEQRKPILIKTNDCKKNSAKVTTSKTVGK